MNTNTFNAYKLVGTTNKDAEYALSDKVLVAKQSKTTNALRFFEMNMSFPLKPELIWETTPVMSQEDVGDCRIFKTRNSTYIFKRVYECHKNWFIPVSDTGVVIENQYTWSDGTTTTHLADRIKTMMCFNDQLLIRAKYLTHVGDDGNDIFLPEAEVIQFIAGGKGLTCELDPEGFLEVMSRFALYYCDGDIDVSDIHPLNWAKPTIERMGWCEWMDLSRIDMHH